MQGYFDYNASSLLRPQAARVMSAWMQEGGGNPSSMHARGRSARQALENARRSIAALAHGAAARDVVFTSGATESNNTVMRAFAAALPQAAILTSLVEHHSVLATAAALEAAGTRIVRLQPRADGSYDLEEIRVLTCQGPALLCLGHANGESGHILDIDGVLGACSPETLVHLDAAQAAGRVMLRLRDGVDSIAMSGHKFGSPPGIGALMLSSRMRAILKPLLTGGPQEWGLRAGTPNVVGAAAMGAAADASLDGMEQEQARLGELREDLWVRLHEQEPDLLRITPADGLANTLTIAAASANADSLIAAMDLAGFCISSGSACAAGSPEPSHVMRALGIEPRYYGGVLRISMGWSTTRQDCQALAAALLATVRKAAAA
ncbi:MAG TPA: aminotransferase class V-fold PLP-dependent enzyme [Candidatus Binatia bacterium]|nr:aminotransferase class V-fold PLP-dependent enzyme [Candidatus Binatia bacterium]